MVTRYIWLSWSHVYVVMDPVHGLTYNQVYMVMLGLIYNQVPMVTCTLDPHFWFA